MSQAKTQLAKSNYTNSLNSQQTSNSSTDDDWNLRPNNTNPSDSVNQWSKNSNDNTANSTDFGNHHQNNNHHHHHLDNNNISLLKQQQQQKWMASSATDSSSRNINSIISSGGDHNNESSSSAWSPFQSSSIIGNESSNQYHSSSNNHHHNSASHHHNHLNNSGGSSKSLHSSSSNQQWSQQGGHQSTLNGWSDSHDSNAQSHSSSHNEWGSSGNGTNSTSNSNNTSGNANSTSSTNGGQKPASSGHQASSNQSSGSGTSSTTATASAPTASVASRSWAKIVSQQSTSSTTSTSNTSSGTSSTNNSSNNAAQSSSANSNSSNNNGPNVSSANSGNANNMTNSGNNNSSNSGSGSSNANSMSMNKQQQQQMMIDSNGTVEWDIKVNQQVPWNFDPKNAANGGGGGGNNSNGPTSMNSSSANATTANASSSNSSTSSMSNETLISNLLKQQQQQQQQQAQQQKMSNNQASMAAASSSNNNGDTGTEIWQSGNSHNMWDKNQNNMPQSSSPALQNSQNWSPNSSSNKWNESNKSMGDSQWGNSSNGGGAAGQSAGSGQNWLGSSNGDTTAPVNNWNSGGGGQTAPSPLNLVSSTVNKPAVVAPTTPAADIYGWDDPDFKSSKKQDDGTNIWGDPENHRQAKVTKWMAAMAASSKVVPPGASTLTKPGSLDVDSPFQASTATSAVPAPSYTPTSSTTPNLIATNSGISSPPVQSPLNQPGSSWNTTGAVANGASNGTVAPNKLLQSQQSIGPQSQWNNTPAAPSSLLQNDNASFDQWSRDLVDTKSWDKDVRDSLMMNKTDDWDEGRIDTTGWGINMQPNKVNFDPSQGIVDTSKWSSSSPNALTPMQAAQQQQQQQQQLSNGGVGINGPNSTKQAALNGGSGSNSTGSGGSGSAATTPGVLNAPGIDWTSTNMFNNRDDMNDMRNKQGLNNRLGMNQSSNNLANQRMQPMNQLNNQGSQGSSNQLLQQQNSQHNLNKNFQQLNLSQQQQQQRSLLNAIGSTQSANLLSMAGFGNNNSSGLNNGQSANKSPNEIQAQLQLLELFKVVVQLGLVPSDLLNTTKLPPEVLSLIMQLFQSVNQLNEIQKKMNTLNNRNIGGQITPQQFKAESDLLAQEHQSTKDNINVCQSKINAAHVMLKSSNKQQSGSSGGNQASPTSSSSSMLNQQLINSFSGMNLSNDMMSSLANNDSKLFKLIGGNGNNNNGANGILNRQGSMQPQQSGNKQQNMLFGGQSSNSATPSLNQKWGSGTVNSTGGLFDQSTTQSILDDRITPFIPGQLWTGGQSIDDDPNCTPGSFSKPILTETIDPESILNGLATRTNNSSQWPNSSMDLFGSNSSGNGLLGASSGLMGNNLGSSSSGGGFNNNNNRSGRMNSSGNTWSSNNNQFMPQLSLPNQNLLSGSGGSNASSIGEQLWGVRNTGGNIGQNGRGPNGGGASNGALNNGANLASGAASGLNRNSSSFATNPLLNQQQQQQNFFRSNSWNLNAAAGTPSGQNMNAFGNNGSNGNNISVNGGHFLLIKNITPQIDQAALKTLCAQQANGPLTYFRYIPNLGVIVRYNTKEELNNAHMRLNSISLGNTTLSTQNLTEQDLKFLANQM